MVFVDSNVLVYSLDTQDAAKHARARAWLATLWERRVGRLSTQVLHEFYVVVTRKLRPALDRGDARAEVRRYTPWRPWEIDHATIEAAWAVEARYDLHYWDALMVAAAQQQGCGILLTEDLQHDMKVDSVRIVNPFFSSPESVLGEAP